MPIVESLSSLTMPLSPILRPRIPVLPERPRIQPIAEGRFWRSYSGGRQNFSRAFQGEPLKLTISTQDPLPANLLVKLVTTLNASGGNGGNGVSSGNGGNGAWTEFPFVRVDDRALVCQVTPQRPGLHSYRAVFSLDGGATWVRDTIPDAWVLVDPAQIDGLRLYTLIPTVSGTIDDWKTDLRRIQDMGFNAIHLLPVTNRDTSESPYAARDLFTIDPDYLRAGTPPDTGLSQLEEFVAEAQTLGMQLCFDLVLNHVGVQSTMARRAPDWIVPDQNRPDGFRRAGYWSDQGWRTWEDLVLVHYEHPSEAVRAEIWAYMIDYALFWAQYADATGGCVRFDNLHGSDPGFIGALTQALYAKFPNLGHLAEYFTDESTLLRTTAQWGLSLNLATPWDYKFVPQLRDYLTHIHLVSQRIRYFMPVTSHDSGAPAEEFGTADSTIPRYAAAALLGTGATGMPQGVEFGEEKRIEFIGRHPRIIYSGPPRFADAIRRINTILAENPAFRCGENCHFVDGGHGAVIAVFRREDAEDTDALGFLVVCNFDTRNEQRITVDLSPFLSTEGPFLCEELLEEKTQIFPGVQSELLLPPCGVQVLRFPRNRRGMG